MIGVPAVLKLLTPRVVNAIMDYVFKDNVLDEQMESVRARLNDLEKVAHKPKKYIVCKQCKKKAKRSK